MSSSYFFKPTCKLIIVRITKLIGGYAVCFSEAIFTVRTSCSYLIIPYSSPLTNSNGVPEIYSTRGVHGPIGSEGNLPPGDNALLFFNKCQGIFYTCPFDTVGHTKGLALVESLKSAKS